MIKRITIALASTLLMTSYSSADPCHVPVFLESGREYELTHEAGTFTGVVTEIDRKACWLRVEGRNWLNIKALTAVVTSQRPVSNQASQQSPFLPQSPVGSWLCRFASNGKQLGQFDYMADGRMKITGASSNRTGTWSVDSNNTLIWRYDDGGGEELDSWQISGNQLRITEGADSLICDAV